jgi:hypothetical protein
MHEVLRKLQRELADGLSDLTTEQTQVRRSPTAWSIQQIVEHLLLTFESTASIFEARLLKGTPTKATVSLRQSFAQFVVTGLRIFPRGHLSPEPMMPPHPTLRPMSVVELNARIAETMFPMDAAITEAERLFGPKKRAVSHGILGPMSVTQWRFFHFVHGEHHLRQILATRRAFHI